MKHDIESYESKLLEFKSAITNAPNKAMRDVNSFHSLTELSDPVSVGFKLFFRYDSNEGLLAPETCVNSALAYFTRIGDKNRHDLLKNFITHLQKINMEMAFLFQTIDGLDTIREHVAWQMFDKDEALITIGTLETVDFKIQTLMSLYKDIWFDYMRGVEVLPVNLRRFDCSIYIFPLGAYMVNSLYDTSSKNEIYEYMSLPSIKRTYDSYGSTLKDLSNSDELYVKSPDMYNHIVYDLTECEFAPDKSSKGFHEVSNKDVEFIDNDFAFTYRFCRNNWRFYGITGREQYGAAALMQLAVQKNKFDAANLLDKYTNAKENLFGDTWMGNVAETLFDKSMAPITTRAEDIITKYGSLDKLANAGINLGKGLVENAADALARNISGRLQSMFLGNVYGISVDNILGMVTDNANQFTNEFNKVTTRKLSTNDIKYSSIGNTYNKM